MTITIEYGPETLDDLIKVLSEEPLDRRFEAYGNFVLIEPELARGGRMEGETMFWGNFFTVSYVFRITATNDETETIAKLTAAIRENQRRDDYLAQDIPKAR